MNKQPKDKTIYHVNPNCKDSKFCNPHGELGPVTYDYDKFMKWHNTEIQKKVAEGVREFGKYLDAETIASNFGGGCIAYQEASERYLKTLTTKEPS